MGLSVDEWTLVIRRGNNGRRLKTFSATSRCKAILNSSIHKSIDSDNISFSELTSLVTKFKNSLPGSFKFVFGL